MPSDRIYFDYAATAPLDPRIAAAMRPFLEDGFGNPSSLHAPGRMAREAINNARESVAQLLGAAAGEIIFTSSGTEADNLAILGAMGAIDERPAHIIVSAIEHPAVLACARPLRRLGIDITRVPVDADGILSPDALRAALRPHTKLVSIMAANNVIGTLQPIRELARISHEHGALFHTDAVQAAGCVPIDVRRDQIDLLSLSAHKFCGPKGVGALFVRDGVSIEPLIHGGGQERGLRSATENTLAIVGFGEAARIAGECRGDESVRLVQLRNRLFEGLAAAIPETYLIGHEFKRLPGHLCIAFAGYENDAIRLMLELDAAGVSVSTGSACSAHRAAEPSYVLKALGFDPLRACGALRITLGRFTTPPEIERFIDIAARAVRRLRPMTMRAGALRGTHS